MKTILVKNIKMAASGEKKHFQIHVHKTFLYFLARNLTQKFGARFYFRNTLRIGDQSKKKSHFTIILYCRTAERAKVKLLPSKMNMVR